LRLLRLLFGLFSPRKKPSSDRKRWRWFRRDSGWRQTRRPAAGTILRGRCWVIDGDTIIIDNVQLRLAGIDAPELDHPWGQRSKWALVQLCKGKTITARIRPEISYDRLVAECFLPDGRDLSAELVRSGLALDWPNYSGGKYGHLEPSGAREKLWRATARQHGTLRPDRGKGRRLQINPTVPNPCCTSWCYPALWRPCRLRRAGRNTGAVAVTNPQQTFSPCGRRWPEWANGG
jgi:micrococcal nuclease